MKHFLCIFLSLWMAVFGRAATYSSTGAGGNWATAGTWTPGGGPPVSGDTVTISPGSPVTVPLGTSAASARCSITGNATTVAQLTVLGNLTADAANDIRIGGTTANTEGQLTVGPGAIIVGQIYLNCGRLYSSATTKSAMATFNSGSNKGIDTLATGPKQDINVQYCAFLGTGVHKFYMQNTVGNATNEFLMDHCVVAATKDWTIGTTTTPNTTAISVTNSDFRDLVGGIFIAIARITGGVATYAFTHNTIYQTSGTFQIEPNTSTGLLIQSNALFNTIITNNSGGGNVTISKNLFASNINTPNIWTISDAAVASTMDHNYLLEFSAGDNMRGLVSAGSGGSGTTTITYNILDGIDDLTHDKPDLVVPGATSLALLVTNNIDISGGEILVGAHGTDFTPGCNIKNNTISGGNLANTIAVGHIFDPEHTALTVPTLNLANNLVLGNSKTSDQTVNGSTSGANQVITYSDYNNWRNLTTAYVQTLLTVSAGNTALSNTGSHDTGVNEQFVDNTRNAATWNTFFGSGTATNDAVTNYLMTMNGYRGTPNFDQNGTVAAYAPIDLWNWVSYGYSPTNLALRGAGDPSDGSPDKGAMPVVTKCPGGFF